MNDQNATPTRHRVGTGGSLTLNNVSGSVRIRGTDSDEATVSARSGSSGKPPRLTVRRSEGALHVEPERMGTNLLGGALSFGPSSVDFEVEVPRSARVEISTVSADIDARELHGEQHYKSVSGDLKLTEISGRISITTVSGDARLEASGPVEVSGTTTSGDAQLNAPRIDLLRLRTVSGDIIARGAFGRGLSHSVETVSGDLVVEPAAGLTVEMRRALNIASRGGRSLVVGNGEAQLTFRTMSGDVRVAGGVATYRATSADREAPEAPASPPAPVDASSPEPDEGPTEAEAPTTRFPAVPGEDRSLEILRALERGEIDVDEASRQLEVSERG